MVCQYLCFGTEHFPQYYPANLVFGHSQYNYFEVRYKHNMCKKQEIQRKVIEKKPETKLLKQYIFRKIKTHLKNLEQNLNNTPVHTQSKNISLKKEV